LADRDERQFRRSFASADTSGVSTANLQNQSFWARRTLPFHRQSPLDDGILSRPGGLPPRDWEIRVTPVFNINYTVLRENNGVNINVAAAPATDRQLAFRELFAEKRLFDLSDNSILSAARRHTTLQQRLRNFVFNDLNLGGRLFGSLHSNRYQYNFAYFYLLEKDTNSELNTVFQDRRKTVAIANLYRQDLSPSATPAS
jgi:hypothetical protein